MRNVKKIIVHCADTPNFKEFTIDQIDHWHKLKGWKGCGYHKVIHVDGSVHTGRNDEEIGAHCEGHNYESIGICLIGTDDFTHEQINSLVGLLVFYEKKYPEAKVHGHYDFSDKTCPNIDMKEFCETFNL